jgi:hypothetical protein
MVFRVSFWMSGKLKVNGRMISLVASLNCGSVRVKIIAPVSKTEDESRIKRFYVFPCIRGKKVK